VRLETSTRRAIPSEEGRTRKSSRLSGWGGEPKRVDFRGTKTFSEHGGKEE